MFVCAALRSLSCQCQHRGFREEKITSFTAVVPVMTADKADVSRRPLLVAGVEKEVTFDEIPIM